MISDKVTDMIREAGPIDEEVFEAVDAVDAAGVLKDLYEGGWTKVEEEGIISFFESLGATKPLQYGQTEQLKFIEWLTKLQYEKWQQAFNKHLDSAEPAIDNSPEPEPYVPRWNTPPPPPPDDRAEYGQVAFWMMSDLLCHHVDVSIQGQSRTITQYYAGGAPGCGASGCANFDLPAGTYSFTARCTDKSWDGSVVVTAGGCCMLRLAY